VALGSQSKAHKWHDNKYLYYHMSLYER
jgi:hypothetical protein